MITGAGGFLGGYVGRHFRAQGCEVVGFDVVPLGEPGGAPWKAWHRISLPSADLRAILRASPPDIFVHCAGRASVGDSVTDPAADFRSSPVMTFEILNDLRLEAPATRFMFLSSAAVYGNPEALPVGEDAPGAPLSPYGFHKRQCEEICREFAAIFGMSTASARIFSAYGPGLRRQVVWDICAKALGAAPLRLQGTGKESRDFIHGADIARGLHAIALHAPMMGETYNLASGLEVTVAELANRILASLAVRKTVEFDGLVPAGNPLNWRADIGRISALGFRPEVAFGAGIENFARWAREELASSQ